MQSDPQEQPRLTPWRRSWPARVTAVGFIAFIVFGNLWLAQALTGGKGSSWIMSGFTLGLGVAAVGGVGLGALALLRLWRGPELDPDGSADPDVSDNSKKMQ